MAHPQAVSTAIEEFKKGNLSESELLLLVENDRRFRKNIQDNSYLDVQFFVSMAFGESWSSKRARVGQSYSQSVTSRLRASHPCVHMCRLCTCCR